MTTKPHLLVIEDDELLITALEERFTKEGFAVEIERDGTQGLEKIIATKPAAVILDLIIPGKDGLTVLKELEQRAPGIKIPIIVLTNSEDLTYMSEVLSHNVTTYLVKSDQDLSAIVDIVRKNILA
jgi:DNA-binding response OmpR family regulator